MRMKLRELLPEHPDGNRHVVEVKVSPHQFVDSDVFLEGYYETPRKKDYVSSFGMYFPKETIFVAREKAA